jgi:hypothetical protein
MKRWIGLLVGVVGITGCPGAFNDLEDRAPVHVYPVPQDFQGNRYGSVVAAYSGELADGTPVSRVVASGGPDSTFEVLPVWTGGLDLGAPRFQGCERGGCRAGHGTALAGLPAFVSPSNLEVQRMCVLVTAPASASQEPQILCETRTGTLDGLGAQVGNVGLGESVVGLGASNPVGFALLGAPRTAMGRGGVFVLRSEGDGATIAPADELDFSAANLSGSAALGTQMAAAPMPDGRTLLAVAARGMNRVVVAALDDGDPAVDVEVLGCIDAPTGGAPTFASTVAVADVLGDGMPDVIVGGEATEHAPAPVHTFRGASYTGAVGCALANDSDDVPAEQVLQCAGPLDGLRGVDCPGSAFGSAVAAGDLTGNGVAEVIVGAPRATVDGISEAGAVYVFSMDGHDVLTHSSPEDGDLLGTAVTTVLTDLSGTPRAEVVAGIPGANAVAIFLCTALDGDTPDVGRRCIPGN